MAETSKGKGYVGSNQSRFATMQDEERLGGESSPPELTDESGAPHFAKGHAPAQQRMAGDRLDDEARERRGNATNP
jgi:hypothetical protein